jgi:hypothetical protein
MEGSFMRTTPVVLPALLALGATAVAAPMPRHLPSPDASPAIHFAQSTIVIAPSAPPPVREEIVPPPPTTDVVWQPGHWQWNGTQYVWVSGAYVARPRPQVAWVPGHWDQSPTGWTWVEGYWQ